MKKSAILLALGLAAAPNVASAQLLLDTTKISCGDFVALSPADSEMVAAWFSGWFNQKLGYTVVDINAFRQNEANIQKYCAAHPKDQLFGVIQQAVNNAVKKKQ